MTLSHLPSRLGARGAVVIAMTLVATSGAGLASAEQPANPGAQASADSCGTNAPGSAPGQGGSCVPDPVDVVQEDPAAEQARRAEVARLAELAQIQAAEARRAEVARFAEEVQRAAEAAAAQAKADQERAAKDKADAGKGKPADGSVGRGGDNVAPGQGKNDENGRECDDNSGAGDGNPVFDGCEPADGGTPPGGELPGGELPGGELPGGELPGGELPGGELPGGELPGGDVPGGDPTDGNGGENGNGTPTSGNDGGAGSAPTDPPAGGNGQVPGELPGSAPVTTPVGGSTQEGGTAVPTPAQSVVRTPAATGSTPGTVTVRANRAPAVLPFTGGSSQTLLEAGAGMSLLGLLLALAGRRRRVEV